MTADLDAFEKKLRESKAKYVAGLPGKISEIKLIWNQINQHQVQWNTELVLKMENLAHNLAGSGGTFGFPDLSERARQLEKFLSQLSKTNLPPNALQEQSVSDLIKSLESFELEVGKEILPLAEAAIQKSTIIYLLDSDKETAIGLSRQLHYYGCKIEVIQDVSAIDSIKNAMPMLIMLDAGFAELILEGQTLIKALRKKWLMSCPIVYISSRDDFDSRMAAVRAGASAYFTKPIDISLLIERIHILTNAGIVEPYRVLLIEDDEALAQHYALIMEKGGMEVFIETRPEHTLDKVIQFNPELVVMDLYMPNYNGIDLIKLIRQHQSFFTLPIVLLTAEQDVNLQFLAREVGVDDFLVKPITESHLYDSVLSRVQRSRYTNISITKDSLTGLFVHKKINEYLEIHLNISKRYNHSLSYVILDIDHFKKINDTYGHLAGDNALVSLANFLKANLRVTDFIGRYGGEEFVIIFPETDEISAFHTLERLRTKFSEIKHYVEDKIFTITFSGGISSFPKYDNMDTIMAIADKALYYAKKHGRNKISIG